MLKQLNSNSKALYSEMYPHNFGNRVNKNVSMQLLVDDQTATRKAFAITGGPLKTSSFSQVYHQRKIKNTSGTARVQYPTTQQQHKETFNLSLSSEVPNKPHAITQSATSLIQADVQRTLGLTGGLRATVINLTTQLQRMTEVRAHDMA